ncbi:MAG: aldo/keto reductase [Myxococcota bacterium]
MDTRSLGAHGPSVSRIGLGCMFYGEVDEAQVMQTLTSALDLGINHFDTANVYEGGHSETLVGQALKSRREEATIATKCGIVGRNTDGTLVLDTRPTAVRAACDKSLSRLGVETIDLYYLHRFDPAIPIEDTVGAMAQLVQEGKVRHLGLSEVGAQTLERAYAVHPIAAVQCEYSLWTRGVEDSILPACRTLGVAMVAYSPLGRGFLAGSVRDHGSLADRDLRHTVGDRFEAASIQANLDWLAQLEDMAKSKQVTVAQLALAWLLAQGDDVFPIPGSRRLAHLQANAAACSVTLTAEDCAKIEMIVTPERVAGARYNDAMLAQLGR